MKKWTHKQFLNELWKRNEHYRNGEFEVIGKYKGRFKRILCGNKYGLVTPIPNTLLEGFNLGIKNALDKTSYWINQAKEIHGEYRFNYSLVNYVDNSIKVKIICYDRKSIKKFTLRPCFIA